MLSEGRECFGLRPSLDFRPRPFLLALIGAFCFFSFGAFLAPARALDCDSADAGNGSVTSSKDDVTDTTAGANTLRCVLTKTTEDTVEINIASGNPISLAENAAINPSDKVTKLKGKPGEGTDGIPTLKTLADYLIGIATDFITENSDPSDWSGYFDSCATCNPGDTFVGDVNSAIDDVLNDGTSAIKWEGIDAKTAPVILDTRDGGTSSLGYESVAFKDFKIDDSTSDDGITGGGVVGAFSKFESNSESESTATLGGISGSLFTGNEVKASRSETAPSGSHGGTINGGGVAGAYAFAQSIYDYDIHSTPLLNTKATATAAIDGISDSLFIGNLFEGNSENFPNNGGGVVGAYAYAEAKSRYTSNNSAPDPDLGPANANAYATVIIGGISNNLFSGNEVTIKSNSFYGGGIVGAYADTDADGTSSNDNRYTVDESSSVTIGDISNNLFSGNLFEVTQSGLDGGGVLGAAGDTVSIGNMKKNLFAGNQVKVDSGISGGGMAGANGSDISIGNIEENLFAGNTVMTESAIAGGGMVGAGGRGIRASIGKIEKSHFTENTVSADGFVGGGGMVGAFSEYGTASIVSIVKSHFSENTVTTSDVIWGGGMVGATSQMSTASIGGISESHFTGNTVTTTGDLWGGGVVGVSSILTTTIGDIEKSHFTGNEVSSGGSLWGGLLYIADDLTVRNSSFTDNDFTVDDLDQFYGTVSIDTTMIIIDNDPAVPRKVTLEASDGGEIVFDKNTAQDDDKKASNSISFRNILGNTGMVSQEVLNEYGKELGVTLTLSFADAELDIITTTKTSKVALHDPIWVDLDNSRFTMNVSGSGDFKWGGENTVKNTSGGTITLGTGFDSPTITLLPGFSLAAPKHELLVKAGAILDFASTSALGEEVSLNVNELTINGGGILKVRPGSAITGDLVTNAVDATAGVFNFYLPSDIGASDVLLTVDGAATLINGAVRLTVSGGDILENLKTGETITLIDSNSESSNMAAMTTDTKAKVDGFILSLGDEGKDLVAKLCGEEEGCGEINYPGEEDNDKPGPDIVPGPDDDDDNSGGPAGPDIVPEDPDRPLTERPLKSFAEGHLAGTALLNQGADFLIGQALPAALGLGQDGLHPFATLGGGKLRHKTGSHVDVNGATLIAGLASTRAVNAGELTLGAFFEHGEGDYGTHTALGNGQGEVEYSGGGLLARLEFGATPRGNFHAEATARAGLIELDFQSRDHTGAYHSRASYESAHLGLGYLAKLDEYSTLKLYGQALWGRQGGDTVKLTTGGEEVKLKPIDSRRTRLGVRWSSQDADRRRQLYFGAAWEREHDAQARARSPDYRLTRPKLTGNTTVIEAGFVINPTKPLTLEFGVQGHTGRREGVTGSFRMEYRF